MTVWPTGYPAPKMTISRLVFWSFSWNYWKLIETRHTGISGLLNTDIISTRPLGGSAQDDGYIHLLKHTWSNLLEKLYCSTSSNALEHIFWLHAIGGCDMVKYRQHFIGKHQIPFQGCPDLANHAQKLQVLVELKK